MSISRWALWLAWEAIDGIMDYSITPLERAFQLAKASSCASVDDIKQRQRAEGHSIAQITGRVLRKQLQALIQAARGRGDYSCAGCWQFICEACVASYESRRPEVRGLLD